MQAKDLSDLERKALAAAPSVEELQGEDAQAAAALAWLGEQGLLSYTVPSAFGGAAHSGIPEQRVSVQSLCAIRDRLAFASGMLDVMFVEQGLGSYPLALGGRGDWVQTEFDGIMAPKP